MSELTPNLGLFKYNPQTDGKEVFSITTALNNNWDILDEGCGSSRNIGEIVASTVPLTDAGLHLLDGSLIQGSGIYSDFVDYIAGLYAVDPTASYFAQPTTESEASWTQPTLTQNGTMGGNEFACTARSFVNVYRAFNSTNTQNVYGDNANNETITFYNPNKLKVTSIVWNVYDGSRNPINYTVQGSNDGNTYTSIITNQTAVAGASTVMDLSSNGTFYHYYKIIINSFNTGQGNLKTLGISATQLTSENKTAEQVWQEQVATYGVCGKFVYDSTNNTVRLPKYSDKIYTGGGTAPVKGTGKNLGLTAGENVTGVLSTRYSIGIDGFAASGGYSLLDTNAGTVINGNNNTSMYDTTNPTWKTIGVITEGSKSGIVTDLTNITTYLDGYYYIVVATSTKTDIQVDIDEIATDLNGKADVDLSNVSNTSGFRKLIEIYNNGSSWYKIFNEYNPSTGAFIGKWCEQGGYTNATSVAYLKTFPNTDYNLQVSPHRQQNAQIYWSDLGYSKTVSGFTLRITDTLLDWQACGYIN